MKITAMLLLSACLVASAHTVAQRITISEKNAPLQKVFKEIQKQTGYDFLYSIELVQQAGTVNIDLRNATLQDAIEECLKNKPLTYSIIEKTIVVKSKIASEVKQPVVAANDNGEAASLPTIDVTGRVTDSSGAPLQNASIRVRGTKQGTTSDANGNFILKGVDENATIEISYQGYELYTVKANANIGTVGLKMRPTIMSDVIVNTGYQKVKPNEINGSVFVVTKEMLNQQTGPNILDRLNGVTSSMLFNVNKSGALGPNPFSIRGLSTINGPTDPLIVLDNFIFEGKIENINPDDVESVTILKDAAAASIWGARAGNGVIVITTKKGRFNQKLSIEFNSNLTRTKRPDLFYQPQMSVSDLINVEEMMFNKGYFDGDIISGETPGGYPYPLSPAVQVLLNRRNGFISAADSATQINTLKNQDSRKQYDKYLQQDAILQQYSIGLRGGSSDFAWRISGGYNRLEGVQKNKSNKANVTIENSFKVSKQLNLTAGVYYTNTASKSGIFRDYQSAIKVNNSRLTPYINFADDFGNPLAVPKYRNGYLDTAGGGKLLDWKYYPLEDYKHDQTKTNLQELIGNVGLQYQVLKSLIMTANYQYQNQWITSERLSDLESFYTRNLVNQFSEINPSGSVLYRIPKGGILTQTNAFRKSQNFRAQLGYENRWEAHRFQAIIGTELREAVSSGNASTTLYGYIGDPLSYGNVNFFTPYTNYLYGYQMFIPGGPGRERLITDRFFSLYGNIAYSYKEKYFVSLSGRKDASNVFGATTNDKWNPLWSSGAGWLLSSEHFYKETWLPYLKLKGTLGFSGNVDPGKTPLPISSSLTNPITNFPFLRISQLNNPSLRWEKSRQINLGIEFGGKRQVFEGSIEFYHKKGTDLYGLTPYEYTVGGNNATTNKNVASMEGKGVDFILNTQNLSKQVKWTTSFLFNYNTSKTTAYFDPDIKIYYGFGSENVIYPIIGKPLYSIVAYRWGGLNPSGDPQGYVDGQLTTDYLGIAINVFDKGLDGGSLVYKGPSNPPFFGSIINSFAWKGLQLSFNVSYKFGYYFRRPSFTSAGLIYFGEGHKDFERRWQKAGDEMTTSVPAFVYTDYPDFDYRDDFYKYSEANVLKADNIRLQYLNIGYTFNSKSVKFPFKQLQVNFNASNLAIIWKAAKEKIDPDYIYSPAPKQFTVGLRGSF